MVYLRIIIRSLPVPCQHVVLHISILGNGALATYSTHDLGGSGIVW